MLGSARDFAPPHTHTKTKNTYLMYTKTGIGVPAYQAVELFKGGNYTTSVDVWSLGCILYEMIHYDQLFANDIRVGHPLVLIGMLTNKILNHEHQPINESCPAQVKELILKCIDPDSSKRPTTLKLLDDSIELKTTFDKEVIEKGVDHG